MTTTINDIHLSVLRRYGLRNGGQTGVCIPPGSDRGEREFGHGGVLWETSNKSNRVQEETHGSTNLQRVFQ